MMRAFIFTAGHEIGVTPHPDADTLPKPKTGEWKAFLQFNDASACALRGFDLDLFKKQGFQVIHRATLTTPPPESFKFRDPRDKPLQSRR